MSGNRVTQGELVIILRGKWRDRTGEKLVNYGECFPVSAKTVRGWIAETQNPSLSEWAKMQTLAGNTTDVQDFVGGVDETEARSSHFVGEENQSGTTQVGDRIDKR